MEYPTFDDLLGASENRDADVRRAAAFDLGRLGRSGDRRVIPVLVRMLGDVGDYAYGVASDALVSIGEPAAAALIELLGDQEANPWPRGRAARTLATMQAQGAFEPMVAALRDVGGPLDVRRMVAFYLGRLGDQRAGESLIGAMADADEDVEVRKNAAHALGELQDARAFDALLANLRDDTVGNAAGSALQELRDERAVAALLPTFATDDAEWRYAVAAIVGKAGEAAVGPLLDALRSDDWRVRATAARALSYNEADVAIEPLVAVLEGDENATVRAEAANALGFLNGEQIVGALLDGLRDPELDVRRASAQGLYSLAAEGRVGRDILPELEEVAASDRTQVNGRLVVREILRQAIRLLAK